MAWRHRSEAGAAPRGAAAPEPWGVAWAAGTTILYLGAALAAVVVLVVTGNLDLQGAASMPLRVRLALDGVSKAVALGAVLLGHSALTPGEKGSPARPGGAVLAGAVAALAFLPVMIGLTWVQQEAYEAAGIQFNVQELVLKVFQEDESTLLLFAFFAVVAAPLFEEILFRGFLFGGLRRWLGPWSAAVLSAAVFALYHLEIDTLPGLFVLGLALAWLRERTGGLAAPIAMHACYNAVQVAGILVARGG